MFLLTSLAALSFLSVPAFGQQIVLNSAHNMTPIGGTWSSGSKGVITGAGFANPANLSFIYAKTTGVSYSFTEDGYYEIARYRFNGNGSQPNCITAVVNWAHGTFQYMPNGSLVMTPFGDGYQQIQDPCAPVSNFIETYNDTELYRSWQIFVDPIDGPKLHMFQFDGSPLAPQFLISTTPNMLPTQPLRNASNGTASSSANSTSTPSSLSKRSSNSAEVRRWGAAGAVAVSAFLGGALLLLA